MRYVYRRKKAPRFYKDNGQRHVPDRHVSQDGADFYARAMFDHPEHHVFTSSVKVADGDTMAAGFARSEFKKFAKKRGWHITFARTA